MKFNLEFNLKKVNDQSAKDAKNIKRREESRKSRIFENCNFDYRTRMNDDEGNSGNASGDEDNDALIFHIMINEPLTKLK